MCDCHMSTHPGTECGGRECFCHYTAGPGEFTKVPVGIRAIQFVGRNTDEVRNFVGNVPDRRSVTPAFRPVVPGPLSDGGDVIAEVWDKLHSTWVGVKLNQWIIEGIEGEFYPCDDSVFRRSYLAVVEDNTTFLQELAKLINKHSLENGSDTPDFILASFLESVLVDWNHATRTRDRWKGTTP